MGGQGTRRGGRSDCGEGATVWPQRDVWTKRSRRLLLAGNGGCGLPPLRGSQTSSGGKRHHAEPALHAQWHGGNGSCADRIPGGKGAATTSLRLTELIGADRSKAFRYSTERSQLAKPTG